MDKNITLARKMIGDWKENKFGTLLEGGNKRFKSFMRNFGIKKEDPNKYNTVAA